MRQLTYCSNIHPGESWQHVLDNLESHGLSVKRQVSPDASFPLGLRIAQQASVELDAAKIAQFRAWCEQHDCYLLTINGFPYGTFHDQPVKAAVYEPDWRTQERVVYTKRLADLAVALTTRA
ncbi:MAG TPA: xylose isomerase, partial [Cellvibrio sp.]